MAEVSALPRETLDALEALERLTKRYHTITPDQAVAAQRLLLRGHEIEPDADFGYLVAYRQQLQQQQQQQEAAAAAEREQARQNGGSPGQAEAAEHEAPAGTPFEPGPDESA